MKTAAVLLLLALVVAGCGGNKIVGPPGEGWATKLGKNTLDHLPDRAADNDGGVLAKKIGDPTGDD